mmetsp:Transcript_23090/g.58879  ORF Transcript_23090/g.58879 Transcript_23090/m.58879 type:complete len:391 (-) Transcript_23090:3-1175(-)
MALVRADGDGPRRMLRELLDSDERGGGGGVEEAAVVDLVRDEAGQVLEQLGCAPVEHSLIEVLESRAKKLHAGRLIHAARLGADDSVLKSVRDADAVAAADGVCLADRLLCRHLLAVDRHAPPGLELQRDILDLVRRLGRPHAHLGVDDEHGGLDGLEVLGFMGKACQIGIRRVLLLWAHERLDPVLVEVRRHLGAAWELLEKLGITPRGEDGHLGCEHVGVALEAHLVITAARRAVRQHVHLVCLHRLHEATARHVTANARRVPVATVVARLRHDDIEATLGHLVLQVDDDRVHAARCHALLHVLDVRLVGLAEVAAERKHVNALFHESLAHGLAVQAAGDADAHALALVLGRSGPLRRHGCSNRLCLRPTLESEKMAIASGGARDPVA